MATLYIIRGTDGTPRITLSPSAVVDGTDVDLLMHGIGTLQWGQGVNQNFFRLLESHACPEGAALNFPANQDDLGHPGAGINFPIEGQLWYNSGTRRLHYYTGDRWRPTSNVIIDPVTPVYRDVGDLWYNPTDESLKIWDGVKWSLKFLSIGSGSGAEVDWSVIINTPTTYEGYGITNVQPLNSILTSISGLPLDHTGMMKITDGIASLETITITGDMTGSGYESIPITLNDVFTSAPGQWTKVTVNSKGLVTAGHVVTNEDMPLIDWQKIYNTPTTRVGYGITDAQPLDATLTDIAGLPKVSASGILKISDGNVTIETINIHGDVTGSGHEDITVTINDTGVVPGSWTKVTVNAKGQVTAGALVSNSDMPNIDWSKIINTPTTRAGYGITDAQPLDATLTSFAALPSGSTGLVKLTNDVASLDNTPYISQVLLSGDVSGTSLSGSGSVTTTLQNVNLNVGTFTKVTVNAKGLVTAASNLTSSDLPSITWSAVQGKPFNYAGQTGQPSWLWGTNDGTNYYVWNPSKFSVNYADSAGSAGSASSWTGSGGGTSAAPKVDWASNANNATYAASSGGVAWANISGKPAWTAIADQTFWRDTYPGGSGPVWVQIGQIYGCYYFTINDLRIVVGTFVYNYNPAEGELSSSKWHPTYADFVLPFNMGILSANITDTGYSHVPFAITPLTANSFRIMFPEVYINQPAAGGNNPDPFVNWPTFTSRWGQGTEIPVLNWTGHFTLIGYPA